MDITNFMTWFIEQTLSIFSYTFNTLNSITFGGTSLLKVIIFINVIIPFLYVVLTIPKNGGSAIGDTAKITKDKIKRYNADKVQSNIEDWYKANWGEEF